jgi:hypothetical protein
MVAKSLEELSMSISSDFQAAAFGVVGVIASLGILGYVFRSVLKELTDSVNATIASERQSDDKNLKKMDRRA